MGRARRGGHLDLAVLVDVDIEDMDPVVLQTELDLRGEVRVEPAQHVVASHQRHTRTEPGEDVRELDADVAAAQDRHSLR